MKNILGLDVGTNSIGWAIIEHDFKSKEGRIKGMGSRIIPMSQDMISDFNLGKLQSSAAQRTAYRGVRRLRERALNRRRRLIATLKVLGFIKADFKVNHEHSLAFQKRDGKIHFKFPEIYDEMKSLFDKKHSDLENIPHDWSIYYLRKKALSEKISKEELAWVILQFNTKRGYYQLRGDDELNTDDNKYFLSEVVSEITEIGSGRARNKLYEIKLENGISGEYQSGEEPDWLAKRVDLIVSEKKLKDGTIKISFTSPGEDDWTLRKKKTESEIESSHKTVGEYIFSKLLEDPGIKIRGKEVHTIDRKYYRQELIQILEKQREFHAELNDHKLFEKAVNKLYKNNKNHQSNLLKQDIIHLIVDDITFYQRPLKSKKYLISDCKYEFYHYKVDGAIVKKPVKVIPKSHPLFQEYRIWSVIHNIRILERNHRDDQGIIKFDHDVTNNWLDHESKTKLFDLFNSKAEVSHTQILKVLGLTKATHRLNYEEDVKFKGNETYATILKAIKGTDSEKITISTLNLPEKLEMIWHALYSLNQDQNHLEKALSNERLSLPDDAVAAISKIPPFKKEYGALSKKAISKIIPLMRTGKYWEQSRINKKVLVRISHLIDAELDESIPDRVRKHVYNFTSIEDYQGLPDWLASYIVYGRHSESGDQEIYNSYQDIDVNKLLPQHSLRNPTVEKILRETMLVVRDVWKEYGKPDEIHVELGRELKLPAAQRRRYTQRRNENRIINERAKAMLKELKSEGMDVNPHSFGQLELFKLYEEGAVNFQSELDDDIKVIRRKGDPTTSELRKYKLWLDQKYISPYTGQPIPLSNLFSRGYEIEHVIPRSKYYDNSFANKIICEREANEIKSDRTAYQFICDEKGERTIRNGVKILDKDEYEALVLKMFKGNRTKIRNLLSYEVPKSFISRQLNDTRYISRKLMSLLNPVVREKNETETRSKNVLPMVGGITNILKSEWGLHDVWKKLIAPRFERMNELYNTDKFYSKQHGRIDLGGYDTDLKRIDHRHHALDALVIACTSRQNIQYLNSLNNENQRLDLEKILFRKRQNGVSRKIYRKPWESITTDAYEHLQKIVISFKQNHRIINRTKNYYQKYVEKNGRMIKSYVAQKKSPDFWAIRQPLHKDTVFGRREVREYKSVSIANAAKNIEVVANGQIKRMLKKRLAQIDGNVKALLKDLKKNPIVIDGKQVDRTEVIVFNKNYASSRSVLDKSFDRAKIEKKVLGENTKRILLSHLEKHNNDPEQAFSSNGIIDMNKDLHIPIHKVTLIEDLGKKFSLGDTGVNSDKYVEAAKGTNLFFIIYKNLETGEHLITKESTLAFGDAVRLMKSGLPLAAEKEGYDYFILSPGDLVYVFEEDEEKILPEELDTSRVYKCVSFTKPSCFFIPMYVSSPLLNKKEFSALNKQEKSIEEIMIKYNCIKIEVDRLGNIRK